MNDEIVSIKASLRARLRARLGEVPAARRAEDSARARALLARQTVWRQAKTVLFYAPLPDEIDLLPLLEQALADGKTVGLPRYLADTGRYVACRIEDFSRIARRGNSGFASRPRAVRPCR
jgi:5-formyltetrahydrofolate cyclo-ligase